eukprot:NODE_3214_length_814_cov_231.989460.p2 GENE.NODE_3214_length_814_cov_231.989460~~NODE_3214_length_814_cov_231.989460.p2  ORF type:complete len:135 (+),score=6.69 NODE_3214_length_814_cov_231.989460:236-640(+)
MYQPHLGVAGISNSKDSTSPAISLNQHMSDFQRPYVVLPLGRSCTPCRCPTIDPTFKRRSEAPHKLPRNYPQCEDLPILAAQLYAKVLPTRPESPRPLQSDPPDLRDANASFAEADREHAIACLQVSDRTRPAI